jgi:chromate transport protein ChrA
VDYAKHKERAMKGYRILKAVKILVLVVVASAVIGFVVKALWNGLVPQIFGGPLITYWQAVGLFLLSKILLGGFHGHGGGGRGHWREEMKARWETMSEEEREKFRAGMRGRRGWCRPSVEPQV